MRLPPELTDLTIDHLYDDEHALSACALTCRAWLTTVRFHRFRHTSISCDSTHRLHEVLLASPEVPGLVHTLELRGQLGWPPESPAWQGASYTFLTLLPAVTELKLTAVFLEDSVHEALVANLMNVARLTLYRCRFRSFHFFVALVGSFPSLYTLSCSFGLNWRFQFPLPTSIDDNLRQYLPEGLRTLHLGEPWLDEEDPRSSELVTVREMLLLEIHTKRTVHIAQRFLDVLGADTLETLELIIGGTNGLLRIIEREAFTLAPCTRLRSCTLRILFRTRDSFDNEDVRGFATLVSTLSSPLLETIKLSLYVHRARDDHVARRATFAEMRTFDWAGIEELLRQNNTPALRRLVVEGEGESVVLDDYMNHALPDLHARQVVQMTSYPAN
ncbi:hypothetical protein DAEQUDRAFT_724793 [Daedalea quercina L-15889]|uniref:F-box domain-containing protein n=1 Tax=Daedalea quercina L-15889 TaxID=1314783 RepID=A0A165RQH7_9APHY|nr:hypothetical protein DAEQUDRAFT_724793 [Daedalea quercina L-15889]